MRDLTEIVRDNDKAAERERREVEDQVAQLDRWPAVTHRVNLAEPVPEPVLRACELCGTLTASPQDWDCKMPGRKCVRHVVCAECQPEAERGRDAALREIEAIESFLTAALLFGPPGSKPPTIH